MNIGLPESISIQARVVDRDNALVRIDGRVIEFNSAGGGLDIDDGD
jgi:hypothetical protein